MIKLKLPFQIKDLIAYICRSNIESSNSNAIHEGPPKLSELTHIENIFGLYINSKLKLNDNIYFTELLRPIPS